MINRTFIVTLTTLISVIFLLLIFRFFNPLLLLLNARAHSEHEAGVGQVLCVDDPPLQLIPTRSTLAFFVVLNAGSVTEAEETRLATSAPSPEALYTVCPPGASPMRALFFPHFLLQSVTVVGH